MTDLAEALSRTLLLMRTDLAPDVADDELVRALTSTTVVIQVGPDALATHSGQCAAVTAALTMARSGHDVWVDGTDVPMLHAQPPLGGGMLLERLEEVGQDLLPGRRISLGRPERAELAVAIGTVDPAPAQRTVHVNATDWSARLGPPSAWSGGSWPIGGIAAGALAASEAFRTAMRRLASHARAEDYFRELQAPCDAATLTLAPPGTPTPTALPSFDFVSGGAIANAALFAQARIPGVTAHGRVLDDDRSALSNLNRNAMLRRGALGELKVTDLARLSGDIRLAPEPIRFEPGMALAQTVLVGVDDIPSRWAAQASGPAWLGVGATEGFCVLVSSHTPDEPCAGCLHPTAAEPGGPIPTAAFVSLLSGLLLTARWLRSLGPEGPALPDQQIFLNALRPEGWDGAGMPVAANPSCPVGCASSLRRNTA